MTIKDGEKISIEVIRDDDNTIGIAASSGRSVSSISFVITENKKSPVYLEALAEAEKRNVPVEQILAEIFSQGI